MGPFSTGLLQWSGPFHNGPWFPIAPFLGFRPLPTSYTTDQKMKGLPTGVLTRPTRMITYQSDDLKPNFYFREVSYDDTEMGS